MKEEPKRPTPKSIARVITRSDLTATGDLKLVQVQHFDQLGRIRLSRTLEDASTSDATNEATGIKVQTRYRYSGSNSFQLVSNPYRAGQSSQAGGEATMGWTLTTFDQGGRVGTFRQIDVDLADSAVQVAKGVIERTGTAEQLAGARRCKKIFYPPDASAKDGPADVSPAAVRRASVHSCKRCPRFENR